MVLELLSQSVHGEKNDNFQHVNNSNSLGLEVLEIHPPSVLDLSQDTEYAAQAALWGIEVRRVLCCLLFYKIEKTISGNFDILNLI